MMKTGLGRLGRSMFGMVTSQFAPVANDPQADELVDVQSLQTRLWTAQAQAQPGFMVLHAVREGNDIVDFEWDTASAVATRLLAGSTPPLYGQRLVEVMAGHAGRGDVFNQYRQVVERGAARAVQQRIKMNHSVDVLRHAAVRLHDGVAVTLTNLSALRRELALRREIQARTRMALRRGIHTRTRMSSVNSAI